jgi:hypothetical protein
VHLVSRPGFCPDFYSPLDECRIIDRAGTYLLLWSLTLCTVRGIWVLEASLVGFFCGTAPTSGTVLFTAHNGRRP